MKNPVIDIIDRNFVEIVGITIPRPARLSPMQWLNAWEDVVAFLESSEGDGADVPKTS